MGMLTVQQAIDLAIESVKLRTDISRVKKKEALTLLSNIREKDCYIRWDENSVKMRLVQWEKEHGRAPTTTDLQEPGMPHPLTIKRVFDMSPSVFLKLMFPDSMKYHRVVANEWGFNSEQDWLECFVAQFNEHINENMTARRYNILRDKDTPSWETIARHCQVSGWRELMKKAGVEYAEPGRKPIVNEIRVRRSNSPILKEWNDLLTRQEEHLRELERFAKGYKCD